MAQDPRLLLQKADKAAQGATGGFSLFGGRQEKWENAADLYGQAANAFRVQKQSTPSLHPSAPLSTLDTPILTQKTRLRSRPSLRKSRLDNAIQTQ
jgi:Soluble NSF attachment protein, SNAP